MCKSGSTCPSYIHNHHRRRPVCSLAHSLAQNKVLGPSTTQLFRNAAATLAFQPGDELVLSAIDHEANVAPWLDLAERQSLVVKWWRPTLAEGEAEQAFGPRLTARGLEGLLGEKTRLVTCTHASNVLGTIHDLKGISALVRERAPHALVCADGVCVALLVPFFMSLLLLPHNHLLFQKESYAVLTLQSRAYAPHRKIDVKEFGVDLYAFSWYKVYGPHIASTSLFPKGRLFHCLRA